jgi:signal peptidase I
VRGVPATAAAGLAVGLGVAAGLGIAVGRLVRELDAVEVRGRSMVPTLEPGDRLLVETWTYRRRAPRVGEVVVTPDPRSPSRELVKRVAAVDGGRVTLRGDAARSTDSRRFGSVPVTRVRTRAALRYWPPRKAGPIPGSDVVTDAGSD